MSEELIQKDLINNPDKIGKWDFYNIGSTTTKQLKENGIIVASVKWSVFKIKKQKGKITTQEYPGFVFVPLVDE